MTTRILHLSDLHFGSEHHFQQSGNDPESPSLAEAVASALSGAQMLPVDGVLISGDLFSKDQPTDLAHAKPGLRELIEKLGAGVERVYLVPGNRDLSWNEQFKKAPFRFYDELLESLSASPIRHGDLPRAVSLSGGNGGPEVELVLLDSCHLESRDMEGYGRVGERQLRALRSLLAQKRSGSTVRIAALHHHLLPVWGVNPIWNPESPHAKRIGDVSLTVDALNVLKELAAREISIVLHGHQHKPSIVRHENYLGEPYSIVVIGAGSAGAKLEGDTGMRRQFFVHEIEPDTLHCHSFVQSDDHPSVFKSPESTTVSLIPPSHANHACMVDLHVTRIRQANQPAIEETDGDSSNLFYLFLSVVNCVEARRIIHEMEDSWWRDTKRPGRDKPDLVIYDMYDLMGRWDFLLRFRASHSTEAREFARKVEDRLQGHYDHLEAYSRKHFASREFMDVLEEHGSLAYKKEPRSVSIWQTRLGNTEAYESRRCQRAFIVIPCGETFVREQIVRELRIGGRLKDFEGKNGIIESYSISQHDIVLDVFLTCSKTVLLNKLNREVEECLAPYSVQKYTLLCYGYDERLVQGEGSLETGSSYVNSPPIPLGSATTR